MQKTVDFLVLGSGIAGLSYALRVAEEGTVAVVTKGEIDDANTTYAQGGIAAAVDPEDSYEDHVADTLEAGAGLCDREVVETVVREGPDRIQELIELGADFTRQNGRLDLGREGGHSRDRIVHAADTTGREIQQALVERVRLHPNVTVLTHHYALELITEHHLGQRVTRVRPDIHCFGAYVLDEEADRVVTFLARATMLATGGGGQIYLHTTNPSVATGDGYAMAYRAKARIANMEFVQFHPTALFHPDADSFLISEAVRGEGGRLLNQAGERFMPEYDERAELAPRDIVARAIDEQLKTRGDEYVLLDISHRPDPVILEHFPHIAETCASHGIDVTSEPIPVVPAAHYFCGGVRTDLAARTSIDGLFAAGEVACTGLHGANRLASNSLLEGMVFSRRAVSSSVSYADESEWRTGVPDWDATDTERPNEWVLVSHNRDELRRIMWDYVGIVRSRLRLKRAARRTRILHEETEDFFRRTHVSPGLCELRNMIAVGYLIIRSALYRSESRGLHFMADYPEPSELEERDTLI